MNSFKMLTVGLTILFVGLRLCDKIAWSWVWVVSPAWIALGLQAIASLITYWCMTPAERETRKRLMERARSLGL